ncbi:MAG: hypothetical protein R3E50_14420 [Halioglobus sp.]
MPNPAQYCTSATRPLAARIILATGNNFVVEDLAVENTPGDSIKAKGSKPLESPYAVFALMDRRTSSNNGALRPLSVQTRNVLIEDFAAWSAGRAMRECMSVSPRTSSCAAIMCMRMSPVSKSKTRKFADVYDETTANTGGILVFDLPGPPVQGGEATRVFNNQIRQP